MEEILHQLVDGVSHYLYRVSNLNHPRWCRISQPSATTQRSMDPNGLFFYWMFETFDKIALSLFDESQFWLNYLPVLLVNFGKNRWCWSIPSQGLMVVNFLVCCPSPHIDFVVYRFHCMYINHYTSTFVLMAQENSVRCVGCSWLILLSNRLSAVSSLSN